jgi:hypothetical protein
MTTYQNPARPCCPKAVSILPLVGGILALWAEGTIMVALMAMAGICALGSIIWWMTAKVMPATWTKKRTRSAPRTG